MEICAREACDHQRIWRRGAVRISRRRRDPFQRGVSGKLVSAPDRNAAAHSGTGWSDAVGADGLSFSAPVLARNSGLLQSQGIDLRPRSEEAGILRAAEVLSGEAAAAGDRPLI